jgi:glycogen operon protein
VHRSALVFASLTALLFTACEQTRTPRLFHTEPIAPSLTQQGIESLDHMGPVIIDQGVNFAIYSERATRIELLLFEDPEADLPTQQFELQRFGDVWSIYVEGIGVGQHYGFAAWGPNWEYDEEWFPGSIKGFIRDVDAQGNRFNPNKLLIDPYAKALHREHDWLKGSAASGPSRAQSTWAAGVKGVVMESRYEWSENEAEWRAMRQDPNAEGHGWEDLILYEVHPKGLTKNAASGVDHPGSYRGIGEMAGYLAELGITGIELLPVHEKPLDGGYWGYWTLNFFAPEMSYASTQDPWEVADEFKFMVDELHKHGIEVIIDVVYNHTGEGGLWRERIYSGHGFEGVDPSADNYNLDPQEVASLMSFRGFDNAAYYALDESGVTYWNNTGVGNDTRANHRPMRRLIKDSLRWYVEEMHVDGFRFDLAAILGQKDGDYNQWDDPANTVLQEIIDDPVFQLNNTRIIAEPWSAGGNYGSLLGAYPKSSNRDDMAWGEWNARFRDTWRELINEDGSNLSSGSPTGFGNIMLGTSELYSWNDRKPYHAVNFMTAHDGFTLYDLMTYEQKVNGCSPLNSICCDDPTSSWCDPASGDDHNRSRDWGDEATKRQMIRNAFAAMMLAHGTPMMLGGDEWMRTKLGNNNTYTTWSDNEWNWFRWGEWRASDERTRMFDFVKNLIQVRKDYKHAFAPTEYFAPPFAYKSVNNTDEPNWGGRAIMQHFYDSSIGPQVVVLYNMERGNVTFTLPEGTDWYRIVDTQRYFDDTEFLGTQSDPRVSYNVGLSDEPVGGSYEALGSSIVVLVERQ